MRFKYIQQYTVIFFTVLWEISGRQTESINHHHPKWLVNVPKDFENITWPTVGRRLQPSRSNSTFIKKCDEIRGQNPGGRNVGIDFEQLYALENFFWSMNDGLSLELGAIDGTSWNHEAPSQTAAFLEFGWNRILIEANPTYRTPMAKYSPESFSINAAICNEKMLHYIVGSRVKAPAGGIIEFMAPTFIKQFFPFLMSDSENFENFRVENLNWSSVSIPKDHTLIEVACLTLQKALDRAGTGMTLVLLMSTHVCVAFYLRDVSCELFHFGCGRIRARSTENNRLAANQL